MPAFKFSVIFFILSFSYSAIARGDGVFVCPRTHTFTRAIKLEHVNEPYWRLIEERRYARRQHAAKSWLNSQLKHILNEEKRSRPHVARLREAPVFSFKQIRGRGAPFVEARVTLNTILFSATNLAQCYALNRFRLSIAEIGVTEKLIDYDIEPGHLHVTETGELELDPDVLRSINEPFYQFSTNALQARISVEGRRYLFKNWTLTLDRRDRDAFLRWPLTVFDQFFSQCEALFSYFSRAE